MADSLESIQAQLAALRQSFVDQLPQRMATINAAHADWCVAGSPEQLSEYHRLVHSLTGAGATFGYEQISLLARQLERYLKSMGELQTAPVDSDFTEAEALLEVVRAEVAGIKSPAAPEPEGALVGLDERFSDRRLAYLLASDDVSEGDVSRQLCHFGYRVESFESGAALQAAVEKECPAMMLVDIALDEGACAGIDVVMAIQRQQPRPIPVIFFSNNNSFSTRLEAVRAWGVAYLPKPLSIERLVDEMDNLVAEDNREPFRVLVVDDQPDQAQRNALVLRQAGMVAEVMIDSMKVFNTLAEFTPELILMDMYMPHCNGLELAAVIRQQPEYVGVPIVFLSSETDRRTQLDAMRVGGDDFLTKPIKANELIQAVAIRAERYRTLRSMMSRDGLTGLLNHTHVMESLTHEVARAERYGASLSFAMIDIDFFKKVNDTYGHAAGDGVIKSLARLLQQRLRKTDIVGRYGGEEFAVIMPETPLVNATRVMDDLRRLFGEIVHQAGDNSFSVTLSCGVAAVPPSSKVKVLQESADKRLYIAKHGGRNKVVSSDS